MGILHFSQAAGIVRLAFTAPKKHRKLSSYMHDSQVYINNKIKDSTCLTQTNLVLFLFTDIEKKLHGCVETKKFLFECGKDFMRAQPTSEIFLNTRREILHLQVAMHYVLFITKCNVIFILF